MLEIILLIVGIVKAVRRPKLVRLAASDFPDVDPNRFAEWHRAELRATNVFLWATWGAFGVKILVNIVISEMNVRGDAGILLFIIVIGGWIGGLIYANAKSNQAKRLRTEAGVTWPVPKGTA